MANDVQDFDLRQTVLYSGSFGPREIERLRKEISRDMKKFDELKEAVNELKTKDDDELSPAARVKLGVCQFLIGEYKDANASLKKGDGGALVQYYFAKLRLVEGEYDAAVEAYNTAQSAGYNVDDCTLGRAEAYREADKLQQSLQELDSLSGAVEQTAEYLYQRGATVNAIGGNPQEAIALYERAIQVDATHPGALFGLALENNRRGNDEEALDLYKRAAAYFPASVGALTNLGLLYEDMAQYDLAVNCFERVLASYPTNKRVALYLKDVKASLNMREDTTNTGEDQRLRRLLATPISDVELSQRSRNCLTTMQVETLGDLIKKTEQELLSQPNFGDTSLQEIKSLLQARGLELGSSAGSKAPSSAELDANMSEADREKLSRPVNDLDLSVRARKCMQRLEIRTIGELVRKSADDLLSCKNFGVTSLKEISEKLDRIGLKLRGE